MVCSAVCIFSLRFRYEYVSVFGAVKKQTMRCSFTNKCVLQMGIDNRLFYESRVAIFVFEKTIGGKPLKNAQDPIAFIMNHTQSELIRLFAKTFYRISI